MAHDSKSLAKAISKLDRPPAGPNWARFIGVDAATTAKAILAFAKAQPPFNYLTGYAAIKDRIELRIGLSAALKMVATRGAPIGRPQNKSLVEAFFDYDGSRGYSAANPIGFDQEYFKVSREVFIPVSPTSIIREHGNFVPIFACGWSSNPLTRTQRRLLMTIYEDAFFSLTDYLRSPAEMLFFPRVDDDSRRECEVWRRGDYELLSKSELDECLEIFVLARDMARAALLTELDALRERERETAESPASESDQSPDLFSKK